MGRLAQKGLLSPCGHRTRRWLAFPGRVAHTGQGSFRLVPCAPRPHRRSMRVTISIYFSLFKSHVPFCSVFQLAISNLLVEEKAGHLCAVCLGFSRISTPVITTPLSAQGPAAVTQVTDMYCFRPSSLGPIRCIGSFTLAVPACPATGLCSFSRTAPFHRSARDRVRS